MIERVIKLLKKPVNINVIVSILGMLYAFIVYKMRFAIKISVFILVLSVFLIITARAVYSSEDKRKILLYRIIMGICYVLQSSGILLAFPMNFIILFFFFPSVIFFCTLILYAAAIIMLIVGLGNTYTDKLYMTEYQFAFIRPIRWLFRPVNFNLIIMLIVAIVLGYFLLVGVIPLVFLLIVARIVYSAENPQRLTAYRAIMGLCYVGGAIVLLFWGVLMLWRVYSSYFIFIASVYVALLLLFVICIINTYTKRILK